MGPKLSSYSFLKDAEILKERVEQLQLMSEYIGTYYSVQWIRKNVLKQTDEEMEKDFIEKKLHPLDLKNAVSKELNNFLKNFRNNSKLKKLYEEAYPK